MDVYSVTLHVLGLLLLILECSQALSCWHCIADNCEGNPEENYKAVKRDCLEGQFCQKVMFRMQSDIGTTKYSSTVRSCSEDCLDQDDFENCTDWLYTTRGCLKRMCCDDEDLCNAATQQPVAFLQRWNCVLLVLVGAVVIWLSS